MQKPMSNSIIECPSDYDSPKKHKSEFLQNELLSKLLKECMPLENALKEYDRITHKHSTKKSYSIINYKAISILLTPTQINKFRKTYKASFPVEVAPANTSSFYLLAAMYPFMQHLSNQNKYQNEINVLKAICGENTQYAAIQKETNLQDLVDLICPPEKIKVAEFIKISEKDILHSKKMEYKRLFSTIQNQESFMFSSYALKVRICDSEQKCMFVKIENLITEFTGNEKKIIENIKKELTSHKIEKKCAICSTKSCSECIVPVILSPILIFHYYLDETKFTHILEESIDFSNLLSEPISKEFASPSDRRFGVYWLVSFSLKKCDVSYVKNVFKDQWYKKENQRISPVTFSQIVQFPVSIKYAVYVKEELFYLSSAFLEEELNKWKLESLLK
jgi:hypothetical protein